MPTARRRGKKVSEQLNRLITLRGAPESITSDNGSEFTGQAMDLWAHHAGVKLNFIRPGKPVENSYIESFNGRLRDECLNVEVFLDLADARRKLDKWRNDYNQQRPHSALADRPPEEFASVAMQLSFALSAAKRAKDLTQRPFVLRGSSELGRRRPEKSARGPSTASRIQLRGCLKMRGRSQRSVTFLFLSQRWIHCLAPKCSSSSRQCSKMAANSQNKLELETEEWVSG